MLAIAFLLVLQQTTADSARRDSVAAPPDSARRVQRLETVQIRAVRTAVAPVSERTLSRAELLRDYSGQETPILLARAPGLTAYAESGSASNYSYMRLRGIDQTRINFTLDGIPLNEPEDQGLYFSNFPDFAADLQSAQVQRGVGTSTYGVASYAGSVSFESLPVAGVQRGGELRLTRGDFNTSRFSAAYRSGLTARGFAGYVRASAQETDGYRFNSGNSSNSWFASGGWFGSRDAIKATLVAGLSSNEQAYLASPLSVLRMNRRDNPYGNDPASAVDDRFHEDLAALSWTRALSTTTSVATTAYGFDAGGWYDVPYVADTVGRYRLHSRWGGIISALDWKGAGSSASLGLNVGGYTRDHWLDVRPDSEQRKYRNSGYKGEQSVFAKGSTTRGRATLFADVQLRAAQFRYTPTAGTSVAPQRVSWRFFNPKGGASVRLSSALNAYASLGMNGREPTRPDMLGGADDLDSATAAFVLPLTRVHPESVRDLETGLVLRRQALRAQVNLFAMDFHDEIAPIGAINDIGTTLRKNVARSHRRGAEGDVFWTVTPRLALLANASLTDARIRDYTDADGNSYHDVVALLTPKLVTNQGVRADLARWLSVDLDGRYTSRMMMTNTNDARFTVPASWLADAGVTLRVATQSVLVRVENLLDRPAFASGYTDGVEPYYYVVAPRNVSVTMRLVF